MEDGLDFYELSERKDDLKTDNVPLDDKMENMLYGEGMGDLIHSQENPENSYVEPPIDAITDPEAYLKINEPRLQIEYAKLRRLELFKAGKKYTIERQAEIIGLRSIPTRK